MKNPSLRKLALCVFASFITVSDSAQTVADGGNLGFISIDCGASRDYVDEVTGIWYQTDEGFTESGTNHRVAPKINLEQFAPTINQTVMTLRSFPEGERSCYTLKPKQDEQNQNQKQKYMIRAIFAHGNYDLKNQAPAFDLYLGVNYWSTVQTLPYPYDFQIYPYEIIIEKDSNTEMVQVCLVNTGQGTPFINALELRPLNNSLYPAPLPLTIDVGDASERIDLGSGLLPPYWTRFEDDVYGRLWFTGDNTKGDVLQTSVEPKAEESLYKLPSEVLRTALQPQNHSNLLTLNASYGDISNQYYMFLHFAEIVKLPPGHKRIINVTFSDENSLSQLLTLEYLKPVTLSSNKFTNKGYINVTIKAASDSNAPPILNAIEIYKVVPQPNFPTAAQDVKAIKEIKQIYGISKIGWQGDPCVPSKLAWDRLNCSYGNNIRIISLNLSSSKLTGVIAPSFASLEKLESLDLSHNELTGPLPEFLATLANLKFINVTGNRLTGSIPKALREKANLEISIGNNPGLNCLTNSCKEHNKFEIPLIASLSSLAIVTVLVSLVIWRFKMITVLCAESRKKKVLKPKNQAFSYSEVLHITNNFKTTIGEGGFGKVYLGTLEDHTLVAVKLLSSSSKQGYKEFQSEAKLLPVMHHRNLVALVGFCDENDVKALIYEYMDLGDLSGLLSEKNQNVLKWSDRLQVAVDAAKGLEYLHNGCKTPIIHRDLKPSNILLNKFMVAKIADFGLSRAFTNERDSHLSTQPAGTPGYIDPEFHRSGKLDKRSDIYSFGMILLQLITGHPPIRRQLDNAYFIVDWIRPKIECGDIHGIVDQRLNGEFQVSSAWKAIGTAMSCIELQPIQRPDISYVLNELKECLVMEIDHANPNGSQILPIKHHSGQFDSITSLSPR
ncbi:hypothetical protein QN277_024544 [Acacia crassicarpa]|uniref:non-specific serine/threonine protein kinase n=1 Tax=Acacia crassicarpa TaxID=499986 RepID=A0AAE1JF13_9FABA|nr:hypothetical protein QN277_024544 [Acacia crassicarpa]